MTPHRFYVLVSLAGGDRHGSAIMREVLRITDGEVRLWPAKLYRTLDELTAAGLLAELAGEGQHPEGKSRKRRYFRITEAGREALARETQKLQDLVAIARDRNEAPRAPSGER